MQPAGLKRPEQLPGAVTKEIRRGRALVLIVWLLCTLTFLPASSTGQTSRAYFTSFHVDPGLHALRMGQEGKIELGAHVFLENVICPEGSQTHVVVDYLEGSTKNPWLSQSLPYSLVLKVAPNDASSGFALASTDAIGRSDLGSSPSVSLPANAASDFSEVYFLVASFDGKVPDGCYALNGLEALEPVANWNFTALKQAPQPRLETATKRSGMDASATLTILCAVTIGRRRYLCR